jgi:hypothetical protein
MAERRQLPTQIRRVQLARGSKPVVRYQLTVDTGIVDGKRKQLRRRYRTEKEACAALAEIEGQVASGTYVQPSTLTVEQACADWLRSRHKIRPTTAAGYEYILQPVRSELGALAAQDLTHRHIDDPAPLSCTYRACASPSSRLAGPCRRLLHSSHLRTCSARGPLRRPPRARRTAVTTPEGPTERLLGLVADAPRDRRHAEIRRPQQLAGQVHAPLGEISDR